MFHYILSIFGFSISHSEPHPFLLHFYEIYNTKVVSIGPETEKPQLSFIYFQRAAEKKGLCKNFLILKNSF